jgi:MFS-type transporter involved in bile tolerance (Atg22 family)
MVDSLRGVTGDLVFGVRTLHSHPDAARALMLVVVNRVSFGVMVSGSLLLLRNTFHQSINANAALADFVVLSGFAATAALIAAILTPWVTRKIGIPHWSALTVGQASIGMLVFALAATGQNFSLLLLAGFSLGFAGQAVKVCSDTVIQKRIPDTSLGRVFALFDMSVNVALVGGIIAVALISPVSGVAPLLYLGVGVGLALASYWYWRTDRHR